MTNRGWAFDAQTIQINKDLLLLKPIKKMVLCALEFDIALGAVAEDVASDAHIRLVLFFDTKCRYFKEFLEGGFAHRE